MIIQSKIKDYYDYVGHVYGADPLVIYERKPLTALNDAGYRPNLNVEFKIDFRLPEYRRWDGPFRYSYKALVVMDTAYLLQRDEFKDRNYKLYDWDNDPQKLNRRYLNFYFDNYTREYPDSKPRECVIGLTKLVGQPIFIINSIGRDNFISIEANIPILTNYGFAKIAPETKMFQDLTYYIGNTMKTSPDTSPPAVVDSIVRLEQRGFDKKTSFRHRK